MSEIVDALRTQTDSQQRSVQDLVEAIDKTASGSDTSWAVKGAAGLSVLLSVVNVAVLVWQTDKVEGQTEAARQQVEVARQQNEVAVDVQRAQAQITDNEFLSRVRVSADGRGVSVTNRADVAVGSSALWVMESFGGDDHLQEIEGMLEGVPVCSTLRIPRALLLREVQPSSDDEPTDFRKRSPVGVEAHLALQAPSGSWYLAGDNGLFEQIPGPPTPSDSGDAVEPSLRALRQSDRYRQSADGYWGGFSSIATGVVTPTIRTGQGVSGYGPQGRLDSSTC